MSSNIKMLRGGNRPGGGRKVGTGKFGESTKVMRIPTSQEAVISDFLEAYQLKQQKVGINPVTEITLPAIDAKRTYLPLFGSKVPAGFPSPADDHVEKRLDATLGAINAGLITCSLRTLLLQSQNAFQ